MNYSEFVAAVAGRAQMRQAQAENVTRATLETLADRLTEGQAAQLAGQLPRELRRHLHKTTTNRHAQFAESFGLEKFVDRVGDRTGMDSVSADAGAQAVLATIGEAIDRDESQSLMSQLPKDFWAIIRPDLTV